MRYAVVLYTILAPALLWADCHERIVHIIHGDLSGMEGQERYPLTPKTLTEKLLPFQFHTHDTSLIGQDPMIHRAIRRQFHRLQWKGYTIQINYKTDLSDFIAYVEHPKTVALFHVGHMYAEEPLSFQSPPKKPPLLSLFHNGNSHGLSRTSLQVLDRDYPITPSSQLSLFFTCACYGPYAEHTVRDTLNLGAQCRYISSSGIMSGGIVSIEISIITEVKSWIDQLPVLSIAQRTKERSKLIFDWRPIRRLQ